MDSLSGEKGQPTPEDRPSGVYKRSQAQTELDARKVVQAPDHEWVLQTASGEALQPAVRAVGCFLIQPAGFKRHRVFNRLTGYQHVTYGSDEEVDVEYLRQAESWKAKLGPQKAGIAWRQDMRKTRG